MAERYQQLEQTSRLKKPKTNVIAPELGPEPSGRPTAVLDPVTASIRGFGEYLVDEVTRNAHPLEEIPGRREAAQSRTDRVYDCRIRPYRGRTRSRNQGRARTRRHPRSRTLRLSDLC